MSPASGSGAGTLSVQANIAGLAAGTYTGAVTVNAGSAAGSPKTIAVTLAVAAATPPPPTNTQAAINLNCGGQDYTALDGTKWTGDYYYNGGDLLYTGDAITNNQDMPIYRSGRAGLYGDFGYSIPVQNGSYTVTLHFAEIQYWNRGDRVFNVAINGATVLSNFDILSQVAPRAAMTQQFPVSVTNGAIQINVTGIVRKGLLNGIQIASSSSTPTAPPLLVLSGSALSFNATAGGSSPSAQTVSVSNGGGGSLGVDGVEQPELADGIAGVGGRRGRRIGASRSGQPRGGHLLGCGHGERGGGNWFAENDRGDIYGGSGPARSDESLEGHP